MIRSFLCAAAAATLLTACGDPNKPEARDADRTAGPAVSASETPRNEAVDTKPMAGETAQTPGASSFTEAQARGAMEKAGYVIVGPLSQNAEGIWQGKATKDGTETSVSVDYKGVVSAQ